MSRRNGKKVPEGPQVNLSLDTCPEDARAYERWPMLCSLLWPLWSNGKCERLAGRIGLKCIGGYYVVTINCPTEQVQTQMVFETLVDLLEGIENAVRAPTCIWLPDFDSQKKARQQAKQ